MPMSYEAIEIVFVEASYTAPQLRGKNTAQERARSTWLWQHRAAEGSGVSQHKPASGAQINTMTHEAECAQGRG